MEVTPDEVRPANSSNIQVTRSWKWTKSGVSKNGPTIRVARPFR